MAPGIRENLRPFLLLVLINGFVGAMVGIERSILPNLAQAEFGLAAKATAVSFLITFGAVKALGNLLAGGLADRFGRRRVLLAGWLAGFPVPLIVIFAPGWGWIVVANALLGINQALCWSATVIMKIDLAGPGSRGVATAANEWAGYVGVALAALASGWLAGLYGLRPAPFYLGIGIAAAGLLFSLFARNTGGDTRGEGISGSRRKVSSFLKVFAVTSWKNRTLLAASQAGLVTNLKDGVIWGLVPIYLAERGLSYHQIGLVAAGYPLVWGFCQLVTGPLSDWWGRKWLIVAGMGIQGAGLALFRFSQSFSQWLGAAAAIGIGTAMVYPLLLAVVSDIAEDRWRASALGVYRFWRDSGYFLAGLGVGYLADMLGSGSTFALVSAILLLSTAVSATMMGETHGRQ